MKFLLFIILSVFIYADSLSILTNYDEAIKEAKESKKRVLMFMHSDYCPWCKKMKDTTFKDAEAIKFIKQRYVFVSINRDKSSYPDKFFPRFIPTTYLIDPENEEEIYALYGYKSAKYLIKELWDE